MIWRETVERTPALALAEINRLARARIQALADGLERDFGLYIAAGTELEYTARGPHGNILRERVGATFLKTPGDARLTESDLGMLKKLRGTFVERIYPETDMPVMEHAMGWRSSPFSPMDAAAQREQERYYRHPVRQADKLHQLRVSLTAPGHMRRYGAQDIFLQSPDARSAAAQQINLSLRDAHGDNRFTGDGSGFSPLMEAAAQGLLDVQRVTLPLAANYPASSEELRTRTRHRLVLHDLKSTSALAMRRDQYLSAEGKILFRPSSYRLENLLPRADSNPYLAMLQTVGGVDHGVRRYWDEKTGELRPDIPPPDLRTQGFLAERHAQANMPPDFDTAHAQFADSGLARSVCTQDLHRRIGAFYSPQAIRTREAQQDARRFLPGEPGSFARR
jgi:glutamine synthetase